MRILSFDIGGTKIAWALVNENGEIVSEINKEKTPETANEIARLLKKAAAAQTIEGVSVATAGVVYNNLLQGKPNNLPIGYDKINFAQIFNVPFIIENDAVSALWAEYKIGALYGCKNGIMLTLGTDVGCSILCNGQVVRGKTGAAGEYQFDFSGRSLQKLAQEYNLAENDCFLIYKLVQQGNKKATKVYKIWEERMLAAMQMLNQLLDTEIFALSGSLSEIVDYAKVNKALKLLEPHNPPIIKKAQCGVNAGIIGAGLLWIVQTRGITK